MNIIHMKPFVRIEYINPRDIMDERDATHLLIQGDQTSAGNKGMLTTLCGVLWLIYNEIMDIILTLTQHMIHIIVNREIFHYHRAEIAILEVVGKTSSNILSIDRAGVVALWRYEFEYFSGQCRFVPEMNAQIDPTLFDYASFGSEEILPNNPKVYDSDVIECIPSI
jgi:hypothetical protein